MIIDLTITIVCTRMKFERVTRLHVRNVAKSTPSANDVRRVSEAVKTFMATARDDEYIAIHCAYGFNRTGS